MNKKIAKISLLIVAISIVIVSLYIGNNVKGKYTFTDVKGSRNELEDVNLIYQEREGLYKTNQVNISKDGMKVKEYAKEIYSPLGFNKLSLDNRELLKYTYAKEQIYQYENILGSVLLTIEEVNGKAELFASIREKSLDTNKISEYNIKLENNKVNEVDVSYNTIPIIHEGELYIIVGLEKGEAYIDIDENNGIRTSESIDINVYKMDLENKKSELILEKQIADKSDKATFNSSIIFESDNNAYFMIDKYIENEDDYDQELNLIRYNPGENEISTIKIDTDLHEVENREQYIKEYGYDLGYRQIHTYYVHDNKVTFIMDDRNKSDLEIKQITVNLDENNTKTENEVYKIETEDYTVSDNNFYTYGVRNFKILNDKIYFILSSYDTRDNGVKYSTSDNREYVYVLDKDSKDILYIGKIREDRKEQTNIDIIKQEEL